MDDDCREYVLVAIIPPGSTGRLLADTARSLYSLCGAVSPLALPAHLPVAFLKRSWKAVEFTQRLYYAVRPLRCIMEGYERVRRGEEDFLYLSVEATGLKEVYSRVRKAAGRDLLPGEEEPYPSYPGFFLGASDLLENFPLPAVPEKGGGSDLARLAGEVPLPKERTFGTYSLSLLRVCSVVDGAWWEQVSWEDPPQQNSGESVWSH